MSSSSTCNIEKTNDITKMVGSKNLLTRGHAEKALAYLIENDIREIDMKKAKGATSNFVDTLIYQYNKHVKFHRSLKLIFFNVKNPIVVLKIQEAQFKFFDKKGAKQYIKMHDKLMENILNDY